ncbi:putative hydrolase [Paenibacillus mucilaginosus 3016]|uniref:Hydrolase n=2 Tax=Paenibacillus mucilaginosus TaxID=61624 RepID=I0BGQ6_9BACL|nr:alpha/beta hydrolase [Paenibacillus mucilaginosus]AFC29373.1 putative hydrolase [Paenibacillus mucilaginosus 3016]AFH61553.1 hydrolase [Paenibacillus mucilaginosus K02]WFA18089.1 alpha/beta hydrolase [Paenibacillus mucilaginosus]
MLSVQTYHPCGVRKCFPSGSLQLSYLDYGGESDNVLLLLHGHMGNARTFSEVAAKFADWRVISLDQRGHGWSEHPEDRDYSRESYIGDILAFIRTVLGGRPVTLLGHSLGGLNAYQFAARYPELVKAVIVEDIGAEIQADLSFAGKLPERTGSLRELREALKQAGLKSIDYFIEGSFEDERGWGLRCDLPGMRISQENCNGEWWDDWLSSACPILLIHGRHSFVMDEAQAERMVSRRPGARLAVFDTGHGVHTDDLGGYCRAVREFLEGLAV